MADFEVGERVYLQLEGGELREMWVHRVLTKKSIWLRSKPIGEEPCAIDRYLKKTVKKAERWRDLELLQQKAQAWCLNASKNPGRLWPSRVKRILQWAKEDDI